MDIGEYLKHIGYQHFAMQPADVVKRVIRMAWQASRENMQEYQKHEFCKKSECDDLRDGKCQAQIDQDCWYTAKEFHHWLKENGYRIVKGEG